MKTKRIYFKGFFAPIVMGIMMCSMLLIACSKDNNDDNNSNSAMYSTTGNASGSQENPSVTTTGTGALTGTYNASSNVWQYNISWATLSGAATAVELHGPADVGVNGSLATALTITTSGISGSATGNVTLTEQQETDLLAGKYYYTILTAANITGEIRGQITATIQ